MVNDYQSDLLFLCFDFNCNAGLKFYGKVVSKDGNFFDELLNRASLNSVMSVSC